MAKRYCLRTVLVLLICLSAISYTAQAWLDNNQTNPPITRILISAGSGSDLILQRLR